MPENPVADISEITIDPKWETNEDMMATEWRRRMYWISVGTKTHAIWAAMLGVPPYNTLPAFASSANVTSDGFVMATFTRENGECYMGAFIGPFDELKTNFFRLATHCKLMPRERLAMVKLAEKWCNRSW